MEPNSDSGMLNHVFRFLYFLQSVSCYLFYFFNVTLILMTSNHSATITNNNNDNNNNNNNNKTNTSTKEKRHQNIMKCLMTPFHRYIIALFVCLFVIFSFGVIFGTRLKVTPKTKERQTRTKKTQERKQET